MKLSVFLSAIALSTVSVATPLRPPHRWDDLADIPMKETTALLDGARRYHMKSFRDRPCIVPKVRKEWRSLSTHQKKSFHKAVLCLANKRKRRHSSVPSAITRYDEFIGVHNNQTDYIHTVGHFSLWHRYFLGVFEDALEEECGYKQGVPYWDWLVDSESDLPMEKWPIFDPETGFGGAGTWNLTAEEEKENFLHPVIGGTSRGCVPDGPYKYPNFKPSVCGTNSSTSCPNTCLKRSFAPISITLNLQRKVWDMCEQQTEYRAFTKMLEGPGDPSSPDPDLHGGGHFLIGGGWGHMSDIYNSPGDPLFYLHHANLDRGYWLWETKGLPKRLREVGGNIVAKDWEGVHGNITLDFEVHLGSLGRTRKLKELTNSMAGPFCYVYV